MKRCSFGVSLTRCSSSNFPGSGSKKGQSVPQTPPWTRAGGVAQVHPAPQREALAAGVGDGVAEPRVAQELRGGLGEVVADGRSPTCRIVPSSFEQI